MILMVQNKLAISIRFIGMHICSIGIALTILIDLFNF